MPVGIYRLVVSVGKHPTGHGLSQNPRRSVHARVCPESALEGIFGCDCECLAVALIAYEVGRGRSYAQPRRAIASSQRAREDPRLRTLKRVVMVNGGFASLW